MGRTNSVPLASVETGMGRYVLVTMCAPPILLWSEPGIEQVANPVSQQVETEHRRHDRQAGERGDVGRIPQVARPKGESPAPGGRGRRYSHPEKGQSGLCDDRR